MTGSLRDHRSNREATQRLPTVDSAGLPTGGIVEGGGVLRARGWAACRTLTHSTSKVEKGEHTSTKHRLRQRKGKFAESRSRGRNTAVPGGSKESREVGTDTLVSQPSLPSIFHLCFLLAKSIQKPEGREAWGMHFPVLSGSTGEGHGMDLRTNLCFSRPKINLVN